MKNIIRWDPFRAVRTFDPFDEMRSMQREMDRLFGRMLGMERGVEAEHAGLWVPSIESYAKDGKICIKAELPGVEAKDLDLSLTPACRPGPRRGAAAPADRLRARARWRPRSPGT